DRGAGAGGAAADAVLPAVDRRGRAVVAAEAEVDHPSGGRPRERVNLNAAGGGAQADDLAAVVDRRGKAIRTAEGAEVDHPSGRRPRERVRLTAGGGAAAHDLPAVVDGPSSAQEAAGRAAVQQR